MREYSTALEAYKAALNHFDNAAPEYIEAAIYELTAAEQRIQAIIRRMKMEGQYAEG